MNATQPRTIYAFDVEGRGGEPMLGNRRVFAVAAKGILDDMKIDDRGDLYVGAGDWIEVFNPGGLLIGRVAVPNGSTSGSVNVALGDGEVCYGLGVEKLLLAKLRDGNCTTGGGEEVVRDYEGFQLSLRYDTTLVYH